MVSRYSAVIVSSILFSVLAIGISEAAFINVNVTEDLEGAVSSFNFDDGDLSSFKIEFYDTGSLPYTVQLRIDVSQNDENVFTGWTEEKEFQPGTRNNYDVYWYTQTPGSYEVNVRAYLANEIYETAFEVDRKETAEAENVFSITDLRTYDDFIVFDVSSTADVSDVAIIPKDFPIGWVVLQGSVKEIDAGGKATVVLPYDADIWTEREIGIIVASDGGAYMTETGVSLVRLEGFEKFFYGIVDGFRMEK